MILPIIAEIEPGRRIEGAVFPRAIGEPVATAAIGRRISHRRRRRRSAGDRCTEGQAPEPPRRYCCAISATAITVAAISVAGSAVIAATPAPLHLLHGLQIDRTQRRQAGPR